MDAAQIALPILGIAAAAAATFYAVSFAEIREKSLSALDDLEEEEEEEEKKKKIGGFRSSASSREVRARRNARRGSRK